MHQEKQEILIAFTGGTPWALGNVWRITAKNTDFYLEPLSEHDAVHLSVHGPNEAHGDGHRFHVKVDRRGAKAVQKAGDFLAHSIARRGHAFDGVELAPGVFRVARIRWTWQLQRPRFRSAAQGAPAPKSFAPHQSAVALSKELPLNEAADLDLVVSYDEPFWPNASGSMRDNARVGPLRNDAGLWLTGTSCRRSEMKYPTPEGLVLPIPRAGQTPNRILGGGPGREGTGDFFWFVESITARELLTSAAASDPLRGT